MGFRRGGAFVHCIPELRQQDHTVSLRYSHLIVDSVQQLDAGVLVRFPSSLALSQGKRWMLSHIANDRYVLHLTCALRAAVDHLTCT